MPTEQSPNTLASPHPTASPFTTEDGSSPSRPVLQAAVPHSSAEARPTAIMASLRRPPPPSRANSILARWQASNAAPRAAHDVDTLTATAAAAFMRNALQARRPQSARDTGASSRRATVTSEEADDLMDGLNKLLSLRAGASKPAAHAPPTSPPPPRLIINDEEILPGEHAGGGLRVRPLDLTEPTAQV